MRRSVASRRCDRAHWNSRRVSPARSCAAGAPDIFPRSQRSPAHLPATLRALRLVRAHAGIFDDLAPLDDLLFDISGEVFRRVADGIDAFSREALEQRR